MKISKILIGLIITLLYINSSKACSKLVAKNDCPFKQETTAYIDYKLPIVSDIDIGGFYKEYIDKIRALEKTGNFKNLEITNQSADITPGYNNNEVTSVTLRVTIKFDLNYDAVSNLYKNFKKSIINVSTYEIRKCLD